MDKKHQNQMLGLVIGLSLSLFATFAVFAVLVSTGTLQFRGRPVQIELVDNQTRTEEVKTVDKQSSKADDNKVVIKKFTDPNLPDFSFEYPDVAFLSQESDVYTPQGTTRRYKTIKTSLMNRELNLSLFPSDSNSPTGLGVPGCYTPVFDKFIRLNNFDGIQTSSPVNGEVYTRFYPKGTFSFPGDSNFDALVDQYLKLINNPEIKKEQLVACDAVANPKISTRTSQPGQQSQEMAVDIVVEGGEFVNEQPWEDIINSIKGLKLSSYSA